MLETNLGKRQSKSQRSRATKISQVNYSGTGPWPLLKKKGDTAMVRRVTLSFFYFFYDRSFLIYIWYCTCSFGAWIYTHVCKTPWCWAAQCFFSEGPMIIAGPVMLAHNHSVNWVLNHKLSLVTVKASVDPTDILNRAKHLSTCTCIYLWQPYVITHETPKKTLVKKLMK